MDNKLFNIDALKQKINEKRKQEKIIGFTNGCFDLLHQGHISLIKHAKEKCDYLIIGLNTDISVKLIKGNERPIDCQDIRANNLTNMKEVDAVIFFSSITPLELITELNPNILIKGSDYKSKVVVGSDFILSNGGKVEYIPILKGFSTTNIINSHTI